MIGTHNHTVVILSIVKGCACTQWIAGSSLSYEHWPSTCLALPEVAAAEKEVANDTVAYATAQSIYLGILIHRTIPSVP
jgi:hypothetical protein